MKAQLDDFARKVSDLHQEGGALLDQLGGDSFDWMKDCLRSLTEARKAALEAAAEARP